MSESAEEKTKRKLSALIVDYDWQQQHSIFYESVEDCINLPADGNNIKKLLRKHYPDVPFLICYRTIYKKWKGLQAYLTIFSAVKITNISELTDDAFSTDTIDRYRRLNRGKLESTELSIRKQKLHDLHSFFGKSTRRYAVINRCALDKIKYTGTLTTQ